MIKPETVIRWHRMGFRLCWRWKSRPRGGRPKVPNGDPPADPGHEPGELTLGGAAYPRRAAEARDRGRAVDSVSKYMAKSGRGRFQTWKTFLRNHAAGIGAMAFLIVPTVGFKLLFVLVMLKHQRRRLISRGVTAHQRRNGLPVRSQRPSLGMKLQIS